MTVRARVSVTAAVAVVLSVGSGQAQDVPGDAPEKPPFTVKTFPIVSGSDLHRGQLSNGTIRLIGDVDSKSFGLSFSGTLSPQVRMTGKEKLVAYLYIDCDGNNAATGTPVATIDLGTPKQGPQKSTLSATADATAFVPLGSVKCAAIGIANDEPEKPEKPPYVVRTFNVGSLGDDADIKITGATVTLIGEPDSKSFGASYRGTLAPEIDMSGEEKLVVYLYMKCDDKLPGATNGINVGTIKFADIKKGRDPAMMIATTDATTFVPLKDVECAKVGIN